MGWLNKIFKSREKVNLDISFPDILEIEPSTHVRSAAILPGFSRNIANEKKVGSRGINYFTTDSNLWMPPQYSHLEVEVLYDIEGYFARATRAKLSLFSKEGYSYVGKNDQRVNYIKTRFKQIERATGIPNESLFGLTFRDLVVHSNCYWLKIRNTEASGGRVRRVNNRSIKPVAGYFRLPPETMIPEIDRYGNILRWKQDIGGYERIYKKEDIVHFYTNIKAGYPLGVPRIIPAIDDIRALRSLEHNIDVLIHKHIFPIILWQVGTESNPAQEYADGTTEIDILSDAVADMPTEGSLVIPERYDVRAIGIENKALKVEGYLNHFRERLLADLDVSSIDVGIGNSSSRSTAQTLSRNLVDMVKMDQITIEGFSRLVIEELLLESTFSESSILDEENLVYLKFKEIDKESKQAEENHLVDMFLKNAISWPEMRIGMGNELLSKEAEKELYYYKIGREMALIQAVDESSGKGVENKNTPQNQHGTRPSAKLNKDFFRDSDNNDTKINPLLKWHRELESSLQKLWSLSGKDINEAKIQIEIAYSKARSELFTIAKRNIYSLYFDPIKVSSVVNLVETRINNSIKTLQDSILTKLEEDKTPTVVFKSLEYRTKLIYSTIMTYSINLSKFRQFRSNQIDCKIKLSQSACNICQSKLTIIKWNDKLGDTKLPPFHPGCQCGVDEYIGS